MVVKCTSSYTLYSSLDPVENLSCLDVEVADSAVYKVSCCYLVAKSYLTLSTLWTTAHQAPLSLGFSSQEYWGELPCPPPGDFPNPRIKSSSLMSPTLSVRFFTTSTTWEAQSLM